MSYFDVSLCFILCLNGQSVFPAAFLCKMAVDGYAINIDLAPAKELISLQRRCVNNLKQTAKHAEGLGVLSINISQVWGRAISYKNTIAAYGTLNFRKGGRFDDTRDKNSKI